MANPSRPMSRLRDDRGAVAVISAAALVVLLGAAALAVDLGRLAWDRRDLQGVADAAALDAVQAFGQRPDEDYQSLAVASASRNRFDGDVSTRALIRDDGEFREPSGGEQPQAVEVTVSREIDYLFAFFAPEGGSNEVSAVAATEELGAVEIGSRLGSIDSEESEILGLLLDPAGGALNASLVDHTQGVVGAGVELDALATGLGLGALTPQEVLDAPVTVGGVLDAALTAVDGDAAADLQALRDAVGVDVESLAFKLGDILTLGAPGSDAGLDAAVDALSLVRAGVMAAHADTGQAVDLGLAVPNVLAQIDSDDGTVTANLTEASLTIIEPPQMAVGPARQENGEWVTSARTAQINLDVSVAVVDLFAGQQVTVDLALTGARGRADLIDVRCGSADELEVDVTTGLADLDLSTELSSGISDLLSVSVATGFEGLVAGESDPPLVFGPEFGPATPTQQVAGALNLQGSLAQLLGDTTVSVEIFGVDALDTLLDDFLGGLLGNLLDGLLGGLGGLLGGGLDSGDVDDTEDELEGLIGTLLGSTLDSLEGQLLTPLLDGLGVDLAEADVRGLHHECGQRTLVR